MVKTTGKEFIERLMIGKETGSYPRKYLIDIGYDQRTLKNEFYDVINALLCPDCLPEIGVTLDVKICNFGKIKNPWYQFCSPQKTTYVNKNDIVEKIVNTEWPKQVDHLILDFLKYDDLHQVNFKADSDEANLFKILKNGTYPPTLTVKLHGWNLTGFAMPWLSILMTNQTVDELNLDLTGAIIDKESLDTLLATIEKAKPKKLDINISASKFYMDEFRQDAMLRIQEAVDKHNNKPNSHDQHWHKVRLR